MPREHTILTPRLPGSFSVNVQTLSKDVCGMELLHKYIAAFNSAVIPLMYMFNITIQLSLGKLLSQVEF